MPLQHIWLISGYAGSGKDTTANLLSNLLGEAATRDSFAGAVKDEVAAMYDFDRAYLDTQEGKASIVKFPDRPKTVREILIEHAESTKHATHNGVWAERLREPKTSHWILSDWRFVDELLILRIKYPHAAIHTVRVKRLTISPSASYTEHELDSFAYEYTIDNSGSLLYIGNQLIRILDQVHTHTS